MRLREPLGCIACLTPEERSKVAWKLLRLSATLRKVWQGHCRVLEPLYFPACPARVSSVRKIKGYLSQIVGTRWQLHCCLGFGGISIPCTYISRTN